MNKLLTLILIGLVWALFLGVGSVSAEANTDLPSLISFDPESTSLLVATVFIGFLDGLNPYCLGGLVFLLGIVMAAGSRSNAVIVGLTYLVVVALTYGLMMVGFLSTFAHFSYQYLIQVLVGLAALIFAAINIYDYFRHRRAAVLITPKNQSRLSHRIQKMLDPSKGFGTIIFGTIVIALGLTILEFPLTFSLPLIWTNIVARHQINLTIFLLLLAVYLLVYLFDEFIALFSIIFALAKTKSNQKREQALKLVSGIVILFLAVALILDLEILNTLTGSLILIGLALVVSLAIMYFPRLAKLIKPNASP